MLSKIKGKVSYKEKNWFVLDTGFIGFKIFAEQEVLMNTKKGDEISVWTHLVVRENDLKLFGFESIEKLSLFELFITVSGVGPKSALAIIDSSSPSFLRKTIINGEIGSLTKIAGVGRKSAERIIIELRGKMKDEENEGFADQESDLEIYEILTGMGYSTKDAAKVITKLSTNTGDTKERLKEALKIIGT